MVHPTYRHGNQSRLLFPQISQPLTADPNPYLSSPYHDPHLPRFPVPLSLAIVVRYRGTAAGWQPIGQSRTIQDAKRLQRYLSRIAPEATLKLIPTNA
jgi:hypothetical protein